MIRYILQICIVINSGGIFSIKLSANFYHGKKGALECHVTRMQSAPSIILPVVELFCFTEINGSIPCESREFH